MPPSAHRCRISSACSSDPPASASSRSLQATTSTLPDAGRFGHPSDAFRLSPGAAPLPEALVSSVLGGDPGLARPHLGADRPAFHAVIHSRPPEFAPVRYYVHAGADPVTWSPRRRPGRGVIGPGGTLRGARPRRTSVGRISGRSSIPPSTEMCSSSGFRTRTPSRYDVYVPAGSSRRFRSIDRGAPREAGHHRRTRALYSFVRTGWLMSQGVPFGASVVCVMYGRVKITTWAPFDDRIRIASAQLGRVDAVPRRLPDLRPLAVDDAVGDLPPPELHRHDVGIQPVDQPLPCLRPARAALGGLGDRPFDVHGAVGIEVAADLPLIVER